MKELIELVVYIHQATEFPEGDPEREWAKRAHDMMLQILDDHADGAPIHEGAVTLDVRHLLTEYGEITGRKCREFYFPCSNSGG